MADSPTQEKVREAIRVLRNELGWVSYDVEHAVRSLLAAYTTAEAELAETVRLLTICDEQRRKQTNRGLGEFGASAAEIDFRRGLDGMIADFLAAHSPSAAAPALSPSSPDRGRGG